MHRYYECDLIRGVQGNQELMEILLDEMNFLFLVLVLPHLLPLSVYFSGHPGLSRQAVFSLHY